jgi:Transmembrane domain of unknown function (DUF3566)
MSDRTPSAVRTGARTGDSAASADSATGESPPVSATQSIPTDPPPAHPAQRAVQPEPAPAPPVGSSSVPPATGATAVVPPSGGSFVADASAAQAVAETADAPDKGSRAARGRGPAKAGGRGPRRARLQLRHIDTWSALKISLVLSIALFFIWMVAVGVLYGVLSALGVFDTLNDLFGQLGSASGSDVGGGDVVTPGLVFGGAAVIGAINIVLLTALCTVGTFIYNLCADLVGGLELTLSERD